MKIGIIIVIKREIVVPQRMTHIRLSISLLLTSTVFQMYSQQVKIADFIFLRNKKIEAIESGLQQFNIHLYDSNELNNGRTQLSFQNETDAASAFHWVNFLYLEDAQWNNRLSIQTQETELVQSYLREMKQLGFMFTNKKIVDRRVYDVYTNGENTIELICSQIKNTKPVQPYYIFAFYNTDEYKYAFADENKICSVPVTKKNSLFEN